MLSAKLTLIDSLLVILLFVVACVSPAMAAPAGYRQIEYLASASRPGPVDQLTEEARIRNYMRPYARVSSVIFYRTGATSYVWVQAHATARDVPDGARVMRTGLEQLGWSIRAVVCLDYTRMDSYPAAPPSKYDRLR